MNEQTAINPAAASAPVAEVQGTDPAPTAEQLAAAEKAMEAMQNLQKQYFPSSQLETAGAAIQKAIDTVNAAGGQYVFNFDTEQAIPSGYGIAIIPVNKTDKATSTRVTVGVGICAIPELAEVNKTPEGQTFIVDAVANTFIAKCANAIRPRSDGATATSIPFTVVDFITSNRPEGVLVAFNELAPAYVKELKRIGLSLMTKEILRSVLQSKAFAEQQFPKIPQTTWETVINSMIKHATDSGKAPGMLEEWKATRNEAGLPMAEDLDLSALNFDAIGS